MNKILTLLGFVKKEKYENLAIALRGRVAEVNTLKEKILILEVEQKLRVPRPVVHVEEEDPSPEDPVARKSFVARVAAFHYDIMGGKLKRLIADVRADIMSIGRETYGYDQKDFDIYLKGTENAFWLIHQWGELCQSEHLADTRGESELSEADKQILKDKLN